MKQNINETKHNKYNKCLLWIFGVLESPDVLNLYWYLNVSNKASHEEELNVYVVELDDDYDEGC